MKEIFQNVGISILATFFLVSSAQGAVLMEVAPTGTSNLQAKVLPQNQPVTVDSTRLMSNEVNLKPVVINLDKVGLDKPRAGKIKAHYVKINVNRVESILERYQDIPGYKAIVAPPALKSAQKIEAASNLKPSNISFNISNLVELNRSSSGIDAVYVRINTKKVNSILDRYNDIPGLKITIPPLALQIKSANLKSDETIIDGDIVAGSAIQRVSVTNKFKLKTEYIRINKKSIDRILDRYNDIPGGITLEGKAVGLEGLNGVVYDTEKNEFLVNDFYSYKPQVSKHEFKKIFKALEKSDLLGVSLGEEEVVYGALAPDSVLAIQMKMADHFLGGIAFGSGDWIKEYQFPGNYRPQENRTFGGYYAVYFNFKDFTFTRNEKKLVSDGGRMELTLIPLKMIDQELVPDYESIENSNFPIEYEQNLNHIAQHIDSYEKDTRVDKVIKYGEAAAFARSLIASGIKSEVLF